MSRVWREAASLFFALALALAVAAPAAASTIVIINNDGAGEGFNDPTPVSPVGGNPGTTRGAQRLYVFNYAASIWGSILPSDVTIQVLAQFNPLTCSATSGVLGSAGARSAHADFSGAPLTNMWYCQALANKLSGVDQSALEDINATFNSDVDNSTCLGAASWYYGIDGNEGSDIELLPVVLHELGHGLGFATFTTTSTGAFLSGTPDIYAHFLLDKSSGLHWDEMANNNARKTSATNTGNLVWDGSAVNAHAATYLQHEPEVLVGSPGSIAGSYVGVAAAFGPPLDQTGVSAGVVLVDDGSGTTSDACEPIVNGAALAGHIALVDRGICTFVAKVAAAQAAGAVGVIVANNVAGAPIGMSGIDPSITIPSLMISQADGTTIKNALLSGAVTATIRANPARIAGENPTGGVKMYAPNPLESGSSVSHFDTSALPDLLMEPAINSSLHTDVDLTRDLFEDIGWLDTVTSVGSPPTPQAVLHVRSAPNPFHPSTVITVDLPSAGATRVEVYDLQGRLVKRLLDSWLPAGTHAVTWDGTDAQGRSAAAGVYFSRIASAGVHVGQRLVKLNNGS
jgi:hypothetical protein